MSPMTAVFSPMNRILVTKVGNPWNIAKTYMIKVSQIGNLNIILSHREGVGGVYLEWP